MSSKTNQNAGYDYAALENVTSQYQSFPHPSVQGPPQSEYRLYWQRFYILTTFSVLVFNQTLFWLTYGPIGTNTQKYYGVSSAVVDLMLNYGPITFLPFAPLTAWLTTRKGGLRTVTLFVAIAMFVGMLARLLPVVIPGLSHLAIAGMHIGQILNGICGPACMGTPPFLSSQWFAPHERSRATAVGLQMCAFGAAGGFLLMPYVVVEPSDMPTLLWIHAIMSLVGLVLVLIYFPATPPSPPSLAAIRDVSLHTKDSDTSFFSGVKKMMVNSNFLFVALAGGLGQGIVSAWTSVLEQGLSPLGYSQNTAGWFGFGFTMAGLPGGFFFAYIADQPAWRKRLKFLAIVALSLSVVLFAWLTLSMPTWWSSTPPLPSSTAVIGIAISSLGFFVGGSNPMFYELCAELTYPVPEGTSASVITVLNNTFTLIALFITPMLNAQTWNVIGTGSMALCVVALLAAKESYKRQREEETG